MGLFVPYKAYICPVFGTVATWNLDHLMITPQLSVAIFFVSILEMTKCIMTV